jgi:hypothetical protein
MVFIGFYKGGEEKKNIIFYCKHIPVTAILLSVSSR